MNKPISYVFVRNKLISTDSFLPVAVEMYDKLGIRSHFVTFDKKTFNAIKNNIVIKDTIEEVGSLIFPVNKLQKAFLLLEIIYAIIIKKVFLFHFGHLNNGIIKILPLLNQRRTFFCEPDSSGFSKFMFDVDFARNGGEYSIKKNIAPKVGYLLSFGKEWLWLKDDRVKNLKVFTLNHPRTWLSWKKHLEKNSLKYIDTRNLKPKVVGYVLGFFGPTNITLNKTTIQDCFLETLEVLSQLPNASEITIFLKPHPVTSIEILNEIINKFPNLDLRITYIHPSLLAIHSDIAICNLYSTAIYDFSIQGKRTIEYTEYCAEALKVSGGRSCRPEYVDYFINRDKALLTKSLQIALTEEKKKEKVEKNSGAQEFLNFLDSL